MPTEGKWDQYLESVRRYIATDRLDSDEIDYKREIGKKLKDARSALLAGKDEWFDLLKQALSGRQGHPMNWRGADNLRNWLDSDRKAGREALRTVWSDGDLKPGDIRAFSERLPYEGAAKGLRSRLRTISVLLMALGLDRYPPYMAKAYDSSFRRLSYDGPPAGADEEDIYWHALAFLDELASRAKKRGLEKPANRLEAQSIVWVMQRWPEEEAKENTNPPVKTVVDPDMIPLAKELYLPVDFLQNIETLIREKKQVIFQGPPGTGKTYVAQKVARHLAGGRERCQLVQFHPSYSYEDFVGATARRCLTIGSQDSSSRTGRSCRSPGGRRKTRREVLSGHRRDQPREPRQGVRRTLLFAGVPRNSLETDVSGRGRIYVHDARQPVHRRDDEHRRPIHRPG